MFDPDLGSLAFNGVAAVANRSPLQLLLGKDSTAPAALSTTSTYVSRKSRTRLPQSHRTVLDSGPGHPALSLLSDSAPHGLGADCCGLVGCGENRSGSGRSYSHDRSDGQVYRLIGAK